MVRKSIMAALATLSLSSYAMTTGAMSETLRIGVLTDMTSISSQVAGRGSVVAAEMAIEEFGRKPAGMDIELISADHQAKPELAASIAREWIDTQDIDLIVDIPNSAAALAVVELARAKKKLVMLSSSGSTRLVNENCSPYSFQWAWDTYSSAYGPAAAITQDGGKKWFFVTADYASATSWKSTPRRSSRPMAVRSSAASATLPASSTSRPICFRRRPPART